MHQGGRLGWTEQLGEPLDEAVDAGDRVGREHAGVGGQAGDRRQSEAPVELGPGVAPGVDLPAPAQVVVDVEAEPRRGRAVQRGQRAAELGVVAGVGPPRFDPPEHHEAARSARVVAGLAVLAVVGHGEHLRHADRGGGGEPAEPVGLGGEQAGDAVGVGLGEHDRVVGQLDPPGVAAVAPADRSARADRLAQRQPHRLHDRRIHHAPGPPGASCPSTDASGVSEGTGSVWWSRTWARRPSQASSMRSNTSANPLGPP